jgi:hypothetical protein
MKKVNNLIFEEKKTLVNKLLFACSKEVKNGRCF